MEEIKDQLDKTHCLAAPDEMEIDPTEGKSDNPIVIHSQTQTQPRTPQTESINKKLNRLLASVPKKKQARLKYKKQEKEERTE